MRYDDHRWKKAHYCIEAHSHSTVHWTGRSYCLIPAVCSLHHRCRSLQSCRLYQSKHVGHLREYQDPHSWWLERRPWWMPITCKHTTNQTSVLQSLYLYSRNRADCHWPVLCKWSDVLWFPVKQCPPILLQWYEYTYAVSLCLPVSHSVPFHPVTQVQVSTPVQVPPFWQGLEHEAVWKGSSNQNCTLHLRIWGC